MPAKDHNRLSPEGIRARKKAGGIIKALRNRAGYTQRELAQKLSLDYYTFVSAVENGQSRVPAYMYHEMAGYLSVDPVAFSMYGTKIYDPTIWAALYPDGGLSTEQLLDQLGLVMRIKSAS